MTNDRSRSNLRPFAAGLALAALASACGSAAPATRYYELALPADAETASSAAADVAISVARFSVAGAYADQRIVYRASPYRLDYYHYHRWASAPEEQVATLMRRAYEATGRFAHVRTSEGLDDVPVLRGRVLGLEEIDRSDGSWVGRVELLLVLESADGEPVWESRVVEEVPVTHRTPEGLARALSRAVAVIAEKTAPTLASRAREMVARTSAFDR